MVWVDAKAQPAKTTQWSSRGVRRWAALEAIAVRATFRESPDSAMKKRAENQPHIGFRQSFANPVRSSATDSVAHAGSIEMARAAEHA